MSAGVVVGVREWSLDDLGHLVGAREHRWDSRTQVASCQVRGYEHEMARCTCGFYALSARAPVYREAYPDRVLGVAAGWGEVVVGARGWRASHARVVALVDPGALSPVPAYASWTTRRAMWALVVSGSPVAVGLALLWRVGVGSWWVALVAVLLLLASAAYVAAVTAGVRLRAREVRRATAADLSLVFPDVAVHPDLASAMRACGLQVQDPRERARWWSR